jgi:ADP-ribosylglycohydrolase
MVLAVLASSNRDERHFLDAVRKAISLGGDCDTLACMAGGIAQAFYGGVPEAIGRRVYEILDKPQGSMTRTLRRR